MKASENSLLSYLSLTRPDTNLQRKTRSTAEENPGSNLITHGVDDGISPLTHANAPGGEREIYGKSLSELRPMLSCASVLRNKDAWSHLSVTVFPPHCFLLKLGFGDKALESRPPRQRFTHLVAAPLPASYPRQIRVPLDKSNKRLKVNPPSDGVVFRLS